MNDQRIAIITDTGTDTPADFAAAHDVRTVPLRINFSNGESFESGVDITPAELVARLDEEVPKTSLPSPEKILAAFEQARADSYTSAVFVTISSGLSATYETVRLVAEQLGDFPALVVDTKNIGMAAGLVVMEAVRLVEEGVPMRLLGEALRDVAEKTSVFFSVQTLEFLRKGGRIGEAVYRIGSILNIKPVLTCDEAGKYAIAKKARGWQRALDTELKLVEEQARRYPKVRVAMCSHQDPETLDYLESVVRKTVDNVVEVVRSGVSADLLVHTGASLVGIAVQGC